MLYDGVRLEVNLDHAGHVTHWSYYVTRGDEMVGMGAGRGGPFDSVEEAVRQARDAWLDAYGARMSLFE